MKNFLFTCRSLFTRRSLGVGGGVGLHGLLFALILLSFLPNTLLAQKRNVWKGGQPGHATDWNCPNNWSLNMIPDWASVVVIEQNFQNGRPYPVITKAVDPVQYLVICPGARLEIGRNGKLEVELPDACLLEGELLNHGRLISDEALLAFELSKRNKQ